jgi:hypothetical protein
MSQPSKRLRFLLASEISELFLDTDSGEVSVSSGVSSVEGGSEGVPGVSHPQPYRRTTKIRDLFEILNDTFSQFYNPSENLAIDEVIVPFKGRVIFKQYIPKRRKSFSIKIFKLCDSTGYNMT